MTNSPDGPAPGLSVGPNFRVVQYDYDPRQTSELEAKINAEFSNGWDCASCSIYSWKMPSGSHHYYAVALYRRRPT